MMKASAPSDERKIRAILFDLGNVLIDIDFYRCARIWSEQAGLTVETLASRFRVDSDYQDFECGRTDATGYFQTLRRQLGIDLPDEVMRKGWNAIIRNEKPGIGSCVQKLAGQYPLYVLTNTNPEHEIVWAKRHRGLLSFFEKIFVSSRMGCRKPDVATYRKVAHAIDLSCSQILFFDDAEENIEGARQAGMHAHLVDNAMAIEQHLLKLLP